MAIPETGPLTVDEVVALNLRRVRKLSGLTREDLASRIDSKTADSWSIWRIIDLERGRDRSRKVLWSDVVALARALKVTVFDLVLPPEDRFVTLEPPIGGVLQMDIPRHVFGKWFFGIPGELLTPTGIEGMVVEARKKRSKRQDLWDDPRVREQIAEHRMLLDDAINSGDNNEVAKTMNAYLAAREFAVRHILEGKG